MSYVIREFKHDDPHEAELLADMWNASEAGWPGGWTRGIADTGERVMERKAKMDRLAIFVAEHAGKIVGYCDLHAQPGETDVAYVPLLNVQPDHHGKSVGRRLVLAVLERTVELGFKQLTLGTWSGNLKSVPLYKKTGFFWVPETSAWMKNYMPTILRLPIARAFFEKHDWYGCFKRELTQEPDEITWHGVKVFTYRFDADGETLEVVIDKQSERVTAVETDELAIACFVGAEDVPAGLEHPVRWEITNKRSEGPPCRVTLIAAAEAGIPLDAVETLEVSDTAVITKTFTPPVDVEPPLPGKPEHAVTSTLVIDGEPLLLAPAVRAVPPVEIAYDGTRLIPGKERERVLVTLRNRLKAAVSGTLSVDRNPNLTFDRQSAEFIVGPESWTSCEFWVATQDTGTFTTNMQVKGTARLDDRDVEVTTKPKRVTFCAAPLGSVVASVDDEAKRVRLQSDVLHVDVGLRGGGATVANEITELVKTGMPELGPPFVEGRRTPSTYAYRLSEAGGRCAVTLIAPSDVHTGMVVERTVTLGASPTVRIDQRVINNTTAPQKFKLRLGNWAALHGRITVPTRNGLLHEASPCRWVFPQSEDDLSKRPEDLAESWSAAEGKGCVAGMVWGRCEENTFGTGTPDLTFDLPEIPPQSHVDLEPVYIIAGRGSWQRVREYWRRLHEPLDVPERTWPVPQPVLQVGFADKPLFVVHETTSTTACLTHRRAKTLTGRLQIEGADCDPASFDVIGVDGDNPFTAEVTLRLDDVTPRVEPVTLTFETDEKTESFPSPIVVLGNGGAAACVDEPDGAIRIDNGLLSMRVAAAFAGSIVGVERDGVAQLLSAYPESRPFVWMNLWFGGIHPYHDHPTNPQMAKETFRGEHVERTGCRGIQWQGVKVLCDLDHKDQRGLSLETEYLTAGGSNVIALVTRRINRTDARRRLRAGVATWPQPGGSAENVVLHYDQFKPLYERGAPTDVRVRQASHRRRGHSLPDIDCGRWAATENAQTGQAAALVAGGQECYIHAMDFGQGGVALVGQLSDTVDLEPGETLETLAWMVFCDSLDQARPYRVLAEMGSLP